MASFDFVHYLFFLGFLLLCLPLFSIRLMNGLILSRWSGLHIDLISSKCSLLAR